MSNYDSSTDNSLRNTRHDIRFINSQYDELFHVHDSGQIHVEKPEGGSFDATCEYIDDYHTRVNERVFHICEFAELMERNNWTYEPVLLENEISGDDRERVIEVIEHRSLVCLDNNSDEKLYRAESIFIAAEEGKMNELLDSIDKINLKHDSKIKAGQIAMLDSDYNHRYGADSSGSIKGYVNVYFSCSTKSGLEYVKIKKVTGGYEKEARTVAVNTQSVGVHQKGRTYSSGTKAQTKRYAKGSSTSWTITPPASWIPVSQDTVGTMVGAKCTYGLKRTTNGETWKFSVNCPVVTNAIG